MHFLPTNMAAALLMDRDFLKFNCTLKEDIFQAHLHSLKKEQEMYMTN